jgi:hypothetical protein
LGATISLLFVLVALLMALYQLEDRGFLGPFILLALGTDSAVAASCILGMLGAR